MTLSVRSRSSLASTLIILACLVLFGSVVVPLDVLMTLRYGWHHGAAALLLFCVFLLFTDAFKRLYLRLIDHFSFQSEIHRSQIHDVQTRMRSCHNTEELGTELTQFLKENWRTDHAGLLIWSHTEGEFSFLPRGQFSSQIVIKMDRPVTYDDFLVKTLATERRLFSRGLIDEDTLDSLLNSAKAGGKITFRKIKRTMRWLGATLCVPLMMNEQLVGLLVLGQKKGDGSYTSEEKVFLSHVADTISGLLGNFVSTRWKQN